MSNEWQGFRVVGTPVVGGDVEYPVFHLLRAVHSAHRVGQTDWLIVLVEPSVEEDAQALLAFLRSLPGVDEVEPVESTGSVLTEETKVRAQFIEALVQCEQQNVPNASSAVQAARHRMADRISKHLLAAMRELL